MSSIPSGPSSAGQSSAPTASPTSTVPVASSSPPTPTPPRTSANPKATAAGSTPRPPGAVPTSFGYSATANAKAQITAARAAAKADGRDVLLDFGAGWCGACAELDGTFHTSRIQAELASSYHLVQIDVDTNMPLLVQYAPNNSGGYGLPVLVILSSSGGTRVDTDKSGNPGLDPSSFLAFLRKWA
jgi:hypothetical protein